MPKATDLAVSHTRRVLVYGPPKTGKTVLVANLASHFDRIFWFDFDRGHTVLFNSNLVPKENLEKIIVYDIKDNKDDPNALNVALKVLRGGPTEICWEHGKVSCMICKKLNPTHFDSFHLQSLGAKDLVVFDSLSAIWSSILAQVSAKEPDDYKFLQDDWGVAGKFTDMLCGFIKGAKQTNFACISHVLESDPKDKKPAQTFPMFGTRNFSRNLGKDFDDVVYCDVINGKHIAASSTSWRMNVKTGTRSTAVLEKMEKPDLWALWETSGAERNS